MKETKFGLRFLDLNIILLLVLNGYLKINTQEENSKSLEFEGPSKEEIEETPQPTSKDDLPKDWQFKKAHPQELIIGDTTKGVTTRSKLKFFVNLAFISQIEPKNVDDALCDEFWVLAMQEELNQFERNKVWLWFLDLNMIL